MVKLIYYQDAGHGWIKAPRQLLTNLDLVDKITGYSYQSKTGKTVYLEEDCDASLLLKTLEVKGLVPSIVDVDHGDRSFIRSMERFKK